MIYAPQDFGGMLAHPSGLGVKMANKHYLYWYVVLAAIALLSSLIVTLLSSRPSAALLIAGIVVAIVLPPIIIWVMQKMGYPIGRPVTCPQCGTEMPLFRNPTSLNQALWGGYKCPNCGTEMDARGRRLGPGAAQ